MPMTPKEAIAYLRPIADNASNVGYAVALDTALKALETVDMLQQELKDERYRHERYVDYSLERDQVIDNLRKDLANEKAYREFYEKMAQEMKEKFQGLKTGGGQT